MILYVVLIYSQKDLGEFRFYHREKQTASRKITASSNDLCDYSIRISQCTDKAISKWRECYVKVKERQNLGLNIRLKKC